MLRTMAVSKTRKNRISTKFYFPGFNIETWKSKVFSDPFSTAPKPSEPVCHLKDSYLKKYTMPADLPNRFRPFFCPEKKAQFCPEKKYDGQFREEVGQEVQDRVHEPAAMAEEVRRWRRGVGRRPHRLRSRLPVGRSQHTFLLQVDNFAGTQEPT